MARTNIKAKLIEKKRFSNKAYSINVELYEHNMAIVDVDSKKRFRGKSRWHGVISCWMHVFRKAFVNML